MPPLRTKPVRSRAERPSTAFPRFLFGSALLFAVVAACASVTVKSSVYQKQRFALASFHGPVRVDTSAIGIAGAFQAGNDWGPKVAEAAIDDVRARLERALGVQLMPIEQMVQSPAYASAVPLPGAERYATARGMKPLSADSSNDALLGALAAGLGVEAVIVISNSWSVQRDATTANQYGLDSMHIAIVGADGTRLWDESEEAEARGDWSFKQTGLSLGGATSPEQAIAMSRAAAMTGLERFATAWAANRK